MKAETGNPFARTPRVLFTTVCRPLGEAYGDGPSVGYELLFGQVTRAQGLFSPRANHIHFSLEYIAENLDAPTTVLQYPTRHELIRELERGYEYVGVSFLLGTFHRMKEVVALIREHAPASKIILGGYGTVAPEEVLRPHGDYICREEGVAFMRRLLGEPEVAMPYRHPLVVSRLRVFGTEISRTGMIFAGLGCPNGCDFCCTSHFFHRKHIRLLPTGRDIYDVIQRYQEIEAGMPVVILDEDFLLYKKRAMEFRECVQGGGRPLSIFAFASMKAISQYTVTEILEMGIDGLWIGYEGTRSGYAKQAGKPADELFRELRDHGITILASMIVGFPYQTPEIIGQELEGLLALKPTFAQFLIYGPTPGTPFYERVMSEGLMRADLAASFEKYSHKCTGFTAVVKHPAMSAGEIEGAQARCFREDFHRLGPSIYRSVETSLLGYLKLKDSPSPWLRRKAEWFADDLRKAYPAFLAGRWLGPSRVARQWVGALERRTYAALGPPNWRERLQSLGALAMATWTGLTLKLGLFQHPRLLRRTYRLAGEALPSRRWRRLIGIHPGGHEVEVEQRAESTVWVRIRGKLGRAGAEALAASISQALKKKKERLVLDLARLGEVERAAAERFAEGLRAYRDRIRVVLPKVGEVAAVAALFALYR